MAAPTVRNDNGATLRLVLTYAIFASVWILLSDQALLWVFREPQHIAMASSLKGWFFVGVTSVLLYGLIQRYLRKIQHSLQLEAEARAQSAHSHELLAAIADGMEDAIFAKDLAGRYIFVNRATSLVMGKSREDILGRDSRSLFPAAQAEDLMQHSMQVMTDKRIVTTEEVLASATGNRVFLVTRGPLCHPDGKIFGVFGVSREITAHKQTLERLSTSEEHLRQLNQHLETKVAERSQELLDLYDQAPCGYHSLAPDGRIVRVNKTELALLGYTRDEIIGQTLDAFMTPESVALYRSSMVELARSGRVRDLECDFVCKDGRVQPFLLSADLLRDATGQAGGIRSTLVDNRERKAQTQRILDLNKFLGDVLELLPFGVVVLNMEQQVILRNQLFGSLLAYPPELTAGQPLAYPDLVRFNHARGDYPGQTLDEALAVFDQTCKSRQSARFERLQASGIYLEVRVQPIASNWTLLTFTDVTAHKAAEKSLQAARQVAEAATMAKSEFLANMSHEIRTPMNGILGLAYLLEKANLAPEAARLARKISHTGKTLQGILNDILDFSKIEAGQLALESASFVLSDVLESVATIMVTDPAHDDIELAISPPPVDLRALQGDPLRLGQVLINLVGNAIKFTRAGHVQLAVTRQDHSNSGVSLRFSVSDTGTGIPQEKLLEIFKPFSQADASTTRRFGGTGLGLAISRHLVEKMGSELHVRSVEGQGSEFWFTLALAWAPRSDTGLQKMKGLDVLIADDSAISRDALRATTLGLGWRASVVDSGQAAVQHVLEHKQRQATPQVLLLDWKMPDLDGLDVARAVNKALRGTQGPILILATAYSREELLAQPDSQLADAVLAKPVTPSSLYDAVAAALEKRAGNARRADEAHSQRLHGIRLLVVDDSEVNLEIAQLIFEGEGAQVAIATNGQEAVQWLQAHAGAVDLVLMDVQMPVMDGMRATQWIRSLPALADLPVVALTAGAFKSNQEQALAAGMNEHLTKPMDVELAVAVILRLTGRPEWTGTRNSATQPWLDAQEDMPGLRVRRGLEIWRDAAVYQQYLRKFARDYGAFVADLGPLPLATRQALTHKLRGAAGNLALDLVAAGAAELDELLKNGGDLQACLLQLQQALHIANTSIAQYAGTEPPLQTPAPGHADLARLGPLLERALVELERDTPDGVEPLMLDLEALLPAPQTAALRHAVESFDFRTAEAEVHTLAAALHLTLQTPL
jgi:PAS domain S-box-containing protein